MARRTVCVYLPNLQTTRFLRNNPDLRTRPRPSDSIDQFDSYAWHQVRRKLDHKYEAPFFRVTPEPGLQCHINFNQTRRDVTQSPLPWALLSRFSSKNSRSTKGLPFYGSGCA